MNSFKLSDAGMIFLKFRSIALIFHLEKAFVKLQSMYRNAITENVWARSHTVNCKYLGYKKFNPKTKLSVLGTMIQR